MAAHRYWRLSIVAANQLDLVGGILGPVIPYIAEMQLREVVGGGHSAVIAVYSASTNTALAVDSFNSNTADGWTATSTAVPQQLDVLFDTAVSIAELSLNNAGVVGSYSFDLQSSDDGAAWSNEAAGLSQDLSTENLFLLAPPPVTGTLRADIDMQLVNNTGTLGARIDMRLSNTGTLRADIDMQLANNTGTLRADIDMRLSNTGTLRADIDMQLYTPITDDSRIFSTEILLDDVDISDRITNDISVEISEGAARLATLDILPVIGVIDPYDWIGKKIIINYIENGQKSRLFTGLIHLPIFDTITGITRFKCTDALQETVELTERAIVDQIVGGWWDAAVFKAKDNWTYALQRLSTVAASYDLDVFKNPRVTNWQPKAVADYSFNSVIDKTGQFQFAERRSITNSVKLKFDVRFNRLWSKTYSGSWKIPTTFNSWLAKPYGLPSKQMILDSIKNFEVIASGTTGLPGSGTYIVGSGYQNIKGWVLSDFGKTLAQSAYLKIKRRWSQSVNKTHEIIIQSPTSITKHGLLQVEHNSSVSIENGKDWEQDEPATRTGEVVINTDVSIFNEGIDYINAIDTIINQKATELLASHRQNKFSFDYPLHPGLDIDKTVSVNIPRANVKGKISSLKHVISVKPNSAKAVSSVTLSLYRPNIASQSSDPLTVDTTLPVPSSSSEPLNMATHIGVDFGLPEDDETWNGWVSNFEEAVTQQASTAQPIEVYDERWNLQVPEVPASERDEEKLTQLNTINIAIPQDTSTIKQV